PEDAPVLLVELEVAAHAAVGADGASDRLALGRPAARLPEVQFGRRDQRAGGAHGDAVPAVHAGRLRQRHLVLGGDAGAEAPAGDRDGEGVLGVVAAGLDALVAEDAPG